MTFSTAALRLFLAGPLFAFGCDSTDRLEDEHGAMVDSDHSSMPVVSAEAFAQTSAFRAYEPRVRNYPGRNDLQQGGYNEYKDTSGRPLVQPSSSSGSQSSTAQNTSSARNSTSVAYRPADAAAQPLSCSSNTVAGKDQQRTAYQVIDSKAPEVVLAARNILVTDEEAVLPDDKNDWVLSSSGLYLGAALPEGSSISFSARVVTLPDCRPANNSALIDARGGRFPLSSSVEGFRSILTPARFELVKGWVNRNSAATCDSVELTKVEYRFPTFSSHLAVSGCGGRGGQGDVVLRSMPGLNVSFVAKVAFFNNYAAGTECLAVTLRTADGKDLAVLTAKNPEVTVTETAGGFRFDATPRCSSSQKKDPEKPVDYEIEVTDIKFSN